MINVINTLMTGYKYMFTVDADKDELKTTENTKLIFLPWSNLQKETHVDDSFNSEAS